MPVGAHLVVNPEEEASQRLARKLAQPNVLERLELGEGAELAEVEAPESFVGKTLDRDGHPSALPRLGWWR